MVAWGGSLAAPLGAAMLRVQQNTAPSARLVGTTSLPPQSRDHPTAHPSVQLLHTNHRCVQSTGQLQNRELDSKT